MNTADYLLEAADDNAIAVLTKDSQYTYKDVKRASERLLGELVSIGINPFDRIGILGENSLFWIACYLGILKLGAVAVPFPTVATPEDLQIKQNFLNCKAICVDRRSQRKFAAAFSRHTPLILEEVTSEPGQAEWPEKSPTFDLQRDAALMLTSGTTDMPRAVRVTHRNIQANTDSIIDYLSLDQSDRILVVLPFYYCFGTSLLHTHLRVGGALVLCNTFAYPETALDLIEEKQCTGFAGVPSTYQTLLRNSSFPRREFESLRKVQQAGGKLQVVFLQELMTILPNAQIFVMYGQTEATARLSFLPPNLLKDKLGSIGKGIPGVELCVLNESDTPVKPGEIGEIIAKGDNISPGYLDNPEASAAKFVDGTLRTGDLATVDAQGFIFIVDRKSDFIKVLGHRVSSQEIEAKILELPDVVAAAAIGEPDEIQGEAIKVFISLRKDSMMTFEGILTHCRARMAKHMVPKSIEIVDSLPMNPHGKVVKSLLKSTSSR